MHRTAARLHAALAGQVVTDWQLRWPSAPTGSARGATTTQVLPRGKHILHRLDCGITLHTHLRMEGRWVVEKPQDVTRRLLTDGRLRALVGCTTATALGLELGLLEVVRTEREAEVVGHLGPDLLGPGWDPERAVANLRSRPRHEIGAALLDQRNLAGIGTIWCAETLFTTGQHPWTAVAELDDERLRTIVDQAHTLLTGTLAYTSSVSTGIDRDGQRAFVFERTALPCYRCATLVRAGRIGTPPQDRVMYYCPRCQGGLGAGDDGRRQTRLLPQRAAPRRYR